MFKFKKIANKINSIVNAQVVKFYIKKKGHWDEATKKDLLFFPVRNNKSFPRKSGDLLKLSNWEGNLLAIFVANKNGKDIRYTIGQLEKAEKLAPAWVKENSMG